MQLAARPVAARVPLEEKLSMLQAAAHYLNSFGITSVVNATGDLAELELYAALRDRGTLTVRTRTSFGSVAVQHHLTPAFLTELEQARRLYHDDWVSANLVKFFADGASGLIPPLVYDAHDYEAMVMELDSRGYQIMTHALRTDSVHMILDTYERFAAGAWAARSAAAHRACRSDRRGRHTAVCAAQRDRGHAAFVLLRRGRRRYRYSRAGARRSMALLAAKRRGAGIQQRLAMHLAARPLRLDSTDGDAAGWKSADTGNVAGEALDGAGQGGASVTGAIYVPEERISVADAVRAYTQGSAYAAFADAKVGTLEVGQAGGSGRLVPGHLSVPRSSPSARPVWSRPWWPARSSTKRLRRRKRLARRAGRSILRQGAGTPGVHCPRISCSGRCRSERAHPGSAWCRRSTGRFADRCRAPLRPSRSRK